MAKLKKQTGGLYRAWYKGIRFNGKTPEEAKQKRDEYKYEMEHGIVQPEPVTVFDLAAEWLPVAKGNVRKQTYNQYATIMEKLTDTIGNKLVSAVSPADIKKVWATYNGVSQSYISKAAFLYKSFFQYAVDNKYCRTSPMEANSTRPHRGTKGTHRCLTDSEIRLIETVPHRCQAAAMFMLKAGLRRGEILALERSDIHDDRIYVLKAVNFVNNRPVVDSTKNESSERSMPLFAPLKPFIDGIVKYVLPDENGGICSETAFQRAWESYMSNLSAYVNGIQKRWYHANREWKETHPKEWAHYMKLKEDGKKEEAEVSARGSGSRGSGPTGV